MTSSGITVARTVTFNTAIAELNDPTTDQPRTPAQRCTATKQKVLACLCSADQTPLGMARPFSMTSPANQFASTGRDHYPKDLMSAYSLLLEYKLPTNKLPREPRSDQRSSNTHNQCGSTNASTPHKSTSTTTPAPSATPTMTSSSTVANTPPTTTSSTRPGHNFAQQAAAAPPTSVSSLPPNHGTSLTQWGAMLTQHDLSIDPSWLLLAGLVPVHHVGF